MATSLHARVGPASVLFGAIVSACLGLIGILLLVGSARGHGNPSGTILIGIVGFLFLAVSTVAAAFALWARRTSK